MKRIFYLIAAVIGLCITSSCGKDFFDQVLLDGNWGLVLDEMVTSVNGEVTEPIITECDPFSPRDEIDTQLAIRNISGNQYEFSEYNWNRVSSGWVFSRKLPLIKRNNVLFEIVSGREVEYGHFTVSASELTIESVYVTVELLSGVRVETSTVSRRTYRRLSSLL